MSDFQQAFHRAVNAVLRDAPHVRHEWMSDREIKFFASSRAGFDFAILSEPYGVYPSADGWHGSPWDVTIWNASEVETSVEEFIRSALSPASRLEVHYSGLRPYKWVLYHSMDGKEHFEETGLLIFNWFGKRTVRQLRNEWLPADAARVRS